MYRLCVFNSALHIPNVCCSKPIDGHRKISTFPRCSRKVVLAHVTRILKTDIQSSTVYSNSFTDLEELAGSGQLLGIFNNSFSFLIKQKIAYMLT